MGGEKGSEPRGVLKEEWAGFSDGLEAEYKGKKSRMTLRFFFFFLRAAPAAYGGSQVGAPIRAVATGLHHSHSNTGSEPHL